MSFGHVIHLLGSIGYETGEMCVYMLLVGRREIFGEQKERNARNHGVNEKKKKRSKTEKKEN